MSYFFKTLFYGSFYLTAFLLPRDFNQLSAYVDIPRSGADTTDRMNYSGDPPDRPGLRDIQRSPEYLDDWWGRNDYYYSYHGMVENNGDPYNPAYYMKKPPYYPLPNTGYDLDRDYYEYDHRYYRSNMPR